MNHCKIHNQSYDVKDCPICVGEKMKPAVPPDRANQKIKPEPIKKSKFKRKLSGFKL